MSAFAATPVVIDLDMSVVVDVLGRAERALPADDYACLKRVVDTLVELTRLVRERGTTIARLRRLFGLATSEKIIDVFPAGTPPATTDVSAGANDLQHAEPAEQPSTGDDDDDDDGAQEKTAADRPRKGHGRLPAALYRNAERVAVKHPDFDVGDACPDCARGKLYGLSEPAQVLRVFGQPPLVARACDCERLRCGACGTVFTAPAPEDMRGPKYDATAAAMMVLLRYGVGTPLHRLDRLQDDLGTPVPASTQWEVARDHAPVVEPVWDALFYLAAQGRVLHNDDTRVRILALMGKRRAERVAAGTLPDPERTGLFTTAVVSITDTGPIALFFSGRKHAGENLGALLDERRGTLPPPIQMGDGLDRNVPSDHVVIESNCLAHGRRHIVDEVENFPAECRYVLESLGKVFKNEQLCVEQTLTAEKRLAFHRSESAPVMVELKTWMSAQLDERRVEPNSGLGGAFRYLLKRWDKLTLFLRVPGAPIENNFCERVLKIPIRHRNNSLFYRSENGARVGDVFMTLIHTAQLHGENPFEYLVALLRHEHDVAADPDAWLPWNYRATLAARAATEPSVASTSATQKA